MHTHIRTYAIHTCTFCIFTYILVDLIHIHATDSTESPVSEKESTSKVIETVFGDKDMSSSSASLPEFHHETGEENDKVVLQVWTDAIFRHSSCTYV